MMKKPADDCSSQSSEDKDGKAEESADESQRTMAEELRHFLQECGLGERWFHRVQDLLAESVTDLKRDIRGIASILRREVKGEDVAALENLIQKCQKSMMKKPADDCSSQSSEAKDGKAEESADESQRIMAEELRNFLQKCGLGERWFHRVQNLSVFSVEDLKRDIQGIAWVLQREVKGEDVAALENLKQKCQKPMMKKDADDCSSQSSEAKDGKAEESADESQRTMAEELRSFLLECGLGERWFHRVQNLLVSSVEDLKRDIQGIAWLLQREVKGEDIAALENLIQKCQNPMMAEDANDCPSQSFGDEDGKAEGSADESQRYSDSHGVQSDFLDKLGLTQYFPEKITLQTAMEKCTNKCSSLADLPWYFITKILMLDYTGRDEMISQKMKNDLNADSKNRSNNDGSANVHDRLFLKLKRCSSSESQFFALHPLDVLITVFRCSSNFLRQILSEKLFTCKLSVPLVLPPFMNIDCLFLHWALRNIVLKFQQTNGMPCERSVVNHPTSVVSCLRLGEICRSKSKFLNEMLNSEGHPTFHHRECENGLNKRCLADGVIEVAWRLPSPNSKNCDNLDKQVTFLNLRGDGVSQETNTKLICQISNALIIFVDVDELANQVVIDTLKSIVSNKAEVVLILTKKSKVKLEEKTMRDIENCVEVVERECNHFGLENIIFDFDDKEEKSIKDLKKETENKLVEYLENSAQYSFQSHKDKAESLNIRVDENIPECKTGQEAAFKVVEKACEYGKKNLKISKLPLQCEPWQEWTKLLKEQHRRKKKGADDLSSYMDKIFIEKKDMRKRQLDMVGTSSNSFDIFLEYISQLNSEERLYYLKWLKFYIDDISREILPGIQRKCTDKWNEIHQLEEDDMKDLSALKNDLSKLEKERAESSFGLEHFMREAAQAYEAVEDIGDDVSTEVKQRIVSLPRIMAELMLLGYPLELMDGDAANVPLSWINAVLEQLRQQIGDKKIFVLSVLGVQSSGKSTMLNAMFGLQFAVAAGRCTRGVYAQLVPISKDYLHQKYDYLLVIDTEGLRPAELDEHKLQHDNEIATLVVGLGDVTLVNIRGEGVSDMEDVLQIVTHALLKMKLVNTQLSLQPILFFIHQNVSAHDAAQKLRRGQEMFMKTLDRVTTAAGKQEDAHEYTKFRQLIDFDINTNIWYFSNLWKGDPPMAPANPGYSKNVNTVKHVLLTDIMQKRTLCLSIEKFRTKLNGIWNGILDQDFVFSFKNSLEMEAYISLDEKLSDLTWSLKRRALEWQSGKENEIESSDRRTEDLRNSLESECYSCFAQNYNEAKVKLEDIFKTDEGSSVIEQWRLITFQRLDNCHDGIIRTTTEAIHSKLKVRQAQLDLRREMQHNQGKILEEAKQVAENMRLGENGQGLTDEELQGKFNEKWEKWIMELDKPHEDNINIEERVNMILYGEFPHDYPLVKKALEDLQIQTEHNIRRHFEEAINLYVSQEYNDHRKTASEFLENVLARIRHFVTETQHEGFKGESAEKLIEIANGEIHGLTEVGFISSDEEEFSISMAICTCQYACYEYSKEGEMERVTDGNYRLGKFGIHPYFEQELLKRFSSKLMPVLLKTQQNRLRDFTMRIEEHVNFQGTLGKEEAETYAENIVNKLCEDVELYFDKTEMKEFREEYVQEIVRMLVNMESKDEYLTFKKNYKIQMAVHVSYFALPIFYEKHKRYIDSINPREILKRDYYETYFQIFKNSYNKSTNETALSEVVSERLSKAIEIAVDKDMARELAEDVRNNAEEVKSKPAFLKAILHELLVVDNFEDFFLYLKDTKVSFQRWIFYFIDRYLFKDGNNRYSEIASRMIKSLISQVCEEISKSVVKITKEVSGQDELQQWVKEFHKCISDKLAIPLSDLLTLIQGYDINTLDSFTEHLMNDLKSSQTKLTDIFHKHTKDHLRNEHEDSVYKIIFQECKGCTERCPFCSAPCTLNNEEHSKDGKKHLANEHHPQGCGGVCYTKSYKLMVENCTTNVASDREFRNPDTNGKYHPYNKYQEIYPDWKIDGDPSVEASPYWKWFMCKYECQLVDKYNAKWPSVVHCRPDIPDPWRSITKEDAEKSIDK